MAEALLAVCSMMTSALREDAEKFKSCRSMSSSSRKYLRTCLRHLRSTVYYVQSKLLFDEQNSTRELNHGLWVVMQQFHDLEYFVFRIRLWNYMRELCSKLDETESKDHRHPPLYDPQETVDADQLLHKSPKYMLLVASIAATITYHAGMNPPGGLWQENTADGLHHYRGSDPTVRSRYRVFFSFNDRAFFSNIFRTQGIKYSASAAGSCRSYPNSTYALTKGNLNRSAVDNVQSKQINEQNSTRVRNYSLRVVKLQFYDPEDLEDEFLYLNIQETKPKKCSKLEETESKDHRDPALSDHWLLHKSCKYMLLLAIIAASIMYQAGMNPPGGLLWQEKTADGLHHYRGSDPILRSRYSAFDCIIVTAFLASLVMNILHQSNIFSIQGIKYCASQAMTLLDLLGLKYCASAAGSCREVSKSDEDHHPNSPIIKGNPREATWLVDCGAVHHMTGNKSLLMTAGSYFPMGDDGNGEDAGILVHLANGEEPLRVRGSGSVRTESIALDDVWYVPGLASNLVSTGQLARQGFAINLGAGGCRITSGDALVGTACFTEASQFELDFLRVASSM